MESTNYYTTDGKVAILIDGGYFIKRLKALYLAEQKNLPQEQQQVFDVSYVTKKIKTLCFEHAKKLDQNIYRIFYYDCPPIGEKLHSIMTKKYIKFNETPQYKFKNELHTELKKMRKMALRLGVLNRDKDNPWTIAPQQMTRLLKGEIQISDLDPEKDLILNVRQKQVDLKIGIDIATMTLKGQVSTMVLVAGDGDFVPVAKMARREGIDFILDPMRGHIQPALVEHVDGLYSVFPDPRKKTSNLL